MLIMYKILLFGMEIDATDKPREQYVLENLHTF